MKIYIDQNVNQDKLKEIRKKYSFEIVQEHDTEQDIKTTAKIPKALTIGDYGSFIDDTDFVPGDEFEKIQNIIGKNNNADVSHIYSAYIVKCEFFITEDNDFFKYPKDDTYNKKKTDLEDILKPLRIITLNQLEEHLKTKNS